MKIIASALFLSALITTPSFAQEQQNSDGKPSTLDKAGHIASQPVRDVGLDKDKIPAILQTAVENPYAPLPQQRCHNFNVALGELNAVLGEDFIVGTTQNENRVGKITEAVGRTVVNSLIPFRGLVREISGAAPAERQLQAAVTAGIARRGYLRGVAVAKGCRIVPVEPVQPAQSSETPPTPPTKKSKKSK